MCIEAKDAVTWWTLDPLALSTITFSTAVYTRGLFVLWRSAGIGRGIRRLEASAFYAGQFSLLIALVSPIDRLSDLLFSAHMTQHEILLVVAPPLLVFGRPIVALGWACGAKRRASVMRALDSVAPTRVWRWLSAPLSILVLHGLVLWVWHIPALFEAALRNEAIHTVQHASFLLTAVVFWWGIARGRYGRGGYGLASAFVFATAMHTSILGALLTVASRLWYPLYAVRGAPFAVDVADDQVLAGLIMWIPAGVLLGLLALGLFAAWLGEAGRRAGHAERLRAKSAAPNCADDNHAALERERCGA